MRVDIPSDISSEALFISDRICCVCQVPGRPVQIHHIDEDPSHNTHDNLAVLCLTCHNDTQIHGGFDRKLSANLVRRYRTDWIERIHIRRTNADNLIIKAKAIVPKNLYSENQLFEQPEIPSHSGLEEFIRTLPTLRRLAYEAAQPGWGTGNTLKMNESSYHVVDVLKNAMVILAGFYPQGHFDGENPRDYFTELISTRYRWHNLHLSTRGLGFSGTICSTMASGDVISDAEKMIEEMVLSLWVNWEAGPNDKYKAWLSDWERDTE
jgi:hypothetical protein